MNVFGRILIVGFIGLLGFSSKAIAQGAPALNLTLDAAIQRALERNLNIAVERINPQVVDLTLVEQQAVYRPTVGFNVDNRSQTYPASTQLGGGDVTETDTRTFDVSLGQPVPWGGGNLDVGLNSLRYETTNFFTSFNPVSGRWLTPRTPNRSCRIFGSTPIARRFRSRASTGHLRH